MNVPRIRMRTLLVLIAVAAVPLALVMMRIRPGDPASRRLEPDAEAIVVVDPPTGSLALNFLPGDRRGPDGLPHVSMLHGTRVVVVSDERPPAMIVDPDRPRSPPVDDRDARVRVLGGPFDGLIGDAGRCYLRPSS